MKIVRDPRSGEVHVPKERVAVLAVIHGMKKITVSSAGGGFTQKEQPMPEPGSGYAKVKVQACGVCHSDALTKGGSWARNHVVACHSVESRPGATQG